MPDLNLITLLQAVIGLGLLNVWLVRPHRATPFRGGAAQDLRSEFAAYGLPPWFFFVVGALKIGSGLMLVAGIWVPSLVAPAAGIVIGLMAGALGMHLKVGDPGIKSVPALLMLAMSASVLGIAVS